ncbi:hypothetical protein [uncultured Methylobacterium sp.]|uniref:SPW repeat domain-containing protein n=1 Tax=uncultured Methylobacterium sp. TaxID=157278 RepID=UPI0035CAA875
MLKESTLGNHILLNLASAGLGAVLLASPWLCQADSTPAGVASAVFLGALLVRFSLSGAVRPRTWKAKARLAIGAATVAMPCVPAPGGTPLPLGLLCAVGLITVVLAAAELRVGGGVTARPAAARGSTLGCWLFPGRWGQPC